MSRDTSRSLMGGPNLAFTSDGTAHLLWAQQVGDEAELNELLLSSTRPGFEDFGTAMAIPRLALDEGMFGRPTLVASGHRLATSHSSDRRPNQAWTVGRRSNDEGRSWEEALRADDYDRQWGQGAEVDISSAGLLSLVQLYWPNDAHVHRYRELLDGQVEGSTDVAASPPTYVDPDIPGLPRPRDSIAYYSVDGPTDLLITLSRDLAANRVVIDELSAVSF